MFTKTQKLGMSDRLFLPSAVYKVKTVVFCIKLEIKQWNNLGIIYIVNKVTVKHNE